MKKIIVYWRMCLTWIFEANAQSNSLQKLWYDQTAKQ